MTHGMRTETHTTGLSGPPTWRDTATHYALLPLRVFLGVTFLYAGLDKLTDSAFMQAGGAGSIGDTMRAARDSAALPALVDLALKSPVGFGYAMALGELAVGIGTLLRTARPAGRTRRRADLAQPLADGELGDHPYYYGNDLAYLMAWLP